MTIVESAGQGKRAAGRCSLVKDALARLSDFGAAFGDSDERAQRLIDRFGVGKRGCYVRVQDNDVRRGRVAFGILADDAVGEVEKSYSFRLSQSAV